MLIPSAGILCQSKNVKVDAAGFGCSTVVQQKIAKAHSFVFAVCSRIMPPKAARQTMAAKSERFVEKMKELTQKASEAKKHLKEVRKSQRVEKQRRNRIIKVASRLQASELMEIAGMKDITLVELSSLVTEMHVPRDEEEKQQRVQQRAARVAKAKAAPAAGLIHPDAPPVQLAIAAAADLPLLPLNDDVPTEEFHAEDVPEE